MHKLISHLIRLYLAPGTPTGRLAQRIEGLDSGTVDLPDAAGNVRAIVIPFRTMRDADPERHWNLLCDVANRLQTALDLPAPAVSVSGSDGYGLWLSLAEPIPVALAQEFVTLLHAAYFPDVKLDAASTAVALPPCFNPATQKWAAFIHPGMGASFAEDSGLEMAPPLSGQVAFLEGLQSIDAAQFDAALATLRPHRPARPVAESAPAGLLLKDATLEDIVAFLHAKNIEPTFRHLLHRI